MHGTGYGGPVLHDAAAVWMTCTVPNLRDNVCEDGRSLRCCLWLGLLVVPGLQALSGTRVAHKI